MFIKKAPFAKAFTLTELLVSMAVLGLIATLTLPHMFMSVDRAKKRAAFKEAYQALQEAVQQTFLEGGSSTDVIAKLNPRKICLNDAFQEGCTQFTGIENNEPGVVLQSGVSVFGFFTKNTTLDRYGIGLEDFSKKEYFYVVSNFSESSDVVFNKPIRPGELICYEQPCLDMFKND